MRVEEGTPVYADAGYLDTVDLIVQVNTMNTIEKEEFEGLRRAVLNGTGMAGWHGGIADSYRNTADYLHMIGGQFAHHAGIEPWLRKGEQSDNYIPYTVHVTELGKTHPITAGIEDFDLVTEQYWVLSDEYNAAGDHDAGGAPVGRLEPSGHRAGDLDAPVGQGPHLRLGSRPQARHRPGAARAHHHRARPALGCPG